MKFFALCFSLLILSFPSCQQPPPSLEDLQQQIIQLNRQMEQAYNNGELQKIATFYTEDAIILGPNKQQIKGRQEIKAYWLNIIQPVRWKIEVAKISDREAALYQTDEWQKMKHKPPHWRSVGVQLQEEKEYLYQLGHSKLEYEREDATHHISQIDFILVWQKQTDGSYQILVDTYEKN